ncbi:hypothetical protein [Streptacidiphilus fuscans]|uniref:LigA protein n=1 Tax=Streptacidiphilus fuscans TaxID=2789292 RepID=A0A931BF63_9ACTN|nr:hypothetical protein [Streptacidiphilus fuscans]MBF9072217.1 hypothetical protein [Streptacidiphilus fuscans]MBF9073028.1 hypothetical protein [Streptacidiphilus fuscans]
MRDSTPESLPASTSGSLPDPDRDDEQASGDPLLQQLRSAGAAFTPDNLADLVAGGVADGHRRRHRRNLAIVGGTAALALIAVGGALTPALLGHGTGQQRAEAASAGRRAAPSASTGQSTSTSPVSVEPTPDHAAAMLRTLESLLPKGATFGSLQGRWGLGGGMIAPLASVVYDDSHGASLIELGLNHVAPGASVPGCVDPVYAPNDVCSSETLPDGSRLVVDQGYEYPSRGTGTKDWGATLVRPNGQEVQVSEWNAPQEKGASVSRPTPPLDAAQLRALVTDRAWQPLLAALPAPTAPPVAVPQGPTGDAILNTVNALLPKGVTALHEDTQTGYAEEQLSDGTGGVGLIGINYQHWNPTTDAQTLAQLYAGATVLPDGSKLVVSENPAEKGGSGAVQWIADVLHPDGLRVVAMEFNAPTQGVAADRAEPVLTMAQLKALVTSTLWSSLG